MRILCNSYLTWKATTGWKEYISGPLEKRVLVESFLLGGAKRAPTVTSVTESDSSSEEESSDETEFFDPLVEFDGMSVGGGGSKWFKPEETKHPASPIARLGSLFGNLSGHKSMVGTLSTYCFTFGRIPLIRLRILEILQVQKKNFVMYFLKMSFLSLINQLLLIQKKKSLQM